MKPVPGLCDRCGQRFRLKDLRAEEVLGRKTGLLVCKACYDPSHPQLETRGVKTNDRQSVRNPRSDVGELEASRALFGWRPVGAPLTSTVFVAMGRVTVETT